MDSNLAVFSAVIPANLGGPLLRYNRHSLRKASFWIARETPYYFDHRNRPPEYKAHRWRTPWFEAHKASEIRYWKEMFKNSQEQPLLCQNVTGTKPMTIMPNFTEYAIYPAKDWLLISIEFSTTFIPPGTHPLPEWWYKMTNWEKKNGGGIVTVCQPEFLMNWLRYPLLPKHLQEEEK